MARLVLPACRKGPANSSAALAEILAEMRDRGVRPTALNVLARATDKGLGSAEAARVAKLFERDAAVLHVAASGR